MLGAPGRPPSMPPIPRDAVATSCPTAGCHATSVTELATVESRFLLQTGLVGGCRLTLTLGPVNCQGPTLSVELGLRMALPLPDQDDHLPDQIEAFVHQRRPRGPAAALLGPHR